jgi:hypothetical protein
LDQGAFVYAINVYVSTGSELSSINDPTAPLSGSDEAQYESRAVVNAVKADFVEAVALVERRTLQVLKPMAP